MKLELDMSTKGFSIVFRYGSEESIVNLTGNIKPANVIRTDVLAYHIKYSYS
jgi:hypothetical protein